MAELTLIGLLNFVAGDFCAAKSQGMDTLKSVLLAYSKANDRFGGSNVRRVINNSPAIEVTALAVVATKCPNLLN
jgi:hypothetical protein